MQVVPGWDFPDLAGEGTFCLGLEVCGGHRTPCASSDCAGAESQGPLWVQGAAKPQPLPWWAPSARGPGCPWV